MSDVELKVKGVVVYEGALDAPYVLLRGGSSVYDSGPIVVEPPPPPLPAIDYTNPEFNKVPNQATATDKEVIYHIQRWIFPNGLPKNWDWNEWARVTGRHYGDPTIAGELDRSGFDLGGAAGEGEVKVNLLTDGQTYLYSYTIRPGTKSAEIYVTATKGNQLLEINGNLPGTSRIQKVLNLTPGKRSFALRVKSVNGWVAVQLRQN